MKPPCALGLSNYSVSVESAPACAIGNGLLGRLVSPFRALCFADAECIRRGMMLMTTLYAVLVHNGPDLRYAHLVLHWRAGVRTYRDPILVGGTETSS